MESFIDKIDTCSDYFSALKHLWSQIPISNKIMSTTRDQLFRIYVCEIIYNAIQLFPDIIEYTITFENDNGITILKIGKFEDDCWGQILTSDGCYCNLSRVDMSILYISNKIKSDYGRLCMIIEVLRNGINEPKVKTSFIINKLIIDNATKF